MTLCHLVPALAVLPLLGDALRWQLWLFTSFYTLLDASFPIVWATVGDFYGRKYFATIRGMLSFFYMWGSVAGPVLAGAIYDRSQSYTRVMWGLFLVLAVATLLNALLIKPWRRCATAAQLNDWATNNHLQKLTSAIQTIQKIRSKITPLLPLPHGIAGALP